MKKLFILVFLLLSLGAYSKDKINVGIVFSSGGLGTGFNKMAYDGLKKAEAEGFITFKYVEPSNITEDLVFLRDFSREGNFDLVIGMGTVVAESIKKVATEFPNQKYAIVGGTITVPNTITIDFAEQEMSFLAGALATMMSRSNKIGVLLGMDNRSFNRFKHGFTQGAKYINKDVLVITSYMPTTSSNPFNDPVTGKNISNLMISRGIDVILQVAEGTGNGVFEAAKEKKIYAIGSDTDQDGEAPGTILTSVRVRIDNAVYNLTKEILNGEFKAGYRQSGLAENGVSLTKFIHTKKLIGQEKITRLDKIKKDIISGKIVVPE
uniref:BMP family ABC transporter substrate-binding protein n=1 Tax=Hirondellea gigas TaxID=1518452 RepID=A0A6A7G9G2_9CRUS